MPCKPSCPYFPNPTNPIEFTFDNFGVKHCSHKFICGYNSGTIVSWDINCPREMYNKNKEESNGKFNRK